MSQINATSFTGRTGLVTVVSSVGDLEAREKRSTTYGVGK